MWIVLALLLGCTPQPPVPKGPLPVPGTPGERPPPPPEGPCADNCLLLLEHDYQALRDDGYCEVCKDQIDGACDKPWPIEGPIPCDAADYLRNCIYARLGYDFDKAPEWREVFADEAWYEPNPDFRWEDVSPLQARNAGTLKKLVDTRRCAK